MESFKKKMKTSIKLLIGSSIAFLTLVILGFSLYRMDFKHNFNDKNVAELRLQPFTELNIDENWEISLKQGKVYKIEYPKAYADQINARLVQNGKTVSLGKNEARNSSPIQIEITTLRLNEISIKKNSQIAINAFKSDTMMIALEQGAIFNGDKNNFNNVTFSVLESY